MLTTTKEMCVLPPDESFHTSEGSKSVDRASDLVISEVKFPVRS